MEFELHYSEWRQEKETTWPGEEYLLMIQQGESFNSR